jgi:hypothetical protein
MLENEGKEVKGDRLLKGFQRVPQCVGYPVFDCFADYFQRIGFRTAGGSGIKWMRSDRAGGSVRA